MFYAFPPAALVRATVLKTVTCVNRGLCVLIVPAILGHFLALHCNKLAASAALPCRARLRTAYADGFARVHCPRIHLRAAGSHEHHELAVFARLRLLLQPPVPSHWPASSLGVCGHPCPAPSPTLRGPRQSARPCSVPTPGHRRIRALLPPPSRLRPTLDRHDRLPAQRGRGGWWLPAPIPADARPKLAAETRSQ